MGKHRLRRWLAVAAALALGVAPVLVIAARRRRRRCDDDVGHRELRPVVELELVLLRPRQRVPADDPVDHADGHLQDAVGLRRAAALAERARLQEPRQRRPLHRHAVDGHRRHEPRAHGRLRPRRPSYAINQNEALTFAPGHQRAHLDAHVRRGQGAARADLLDRHRDDTPRTDGYHDSQSATVTLIARSGIDRRRRPSPSPLEGDGDGDADDTVTADTGVISGGFTSLELEVTATSSSKYGVSVVGTTSVLAPPDPPGDHVHQHAAEQSPTVGGSYTVTATGGGSGNPVTSRSTPPRPQAARSNVQTTGRREPRRACGDLRHRREPGRERHLRARTDRDAVRHRLADPPGDHVHQHAVPPSLVVGGSYTVSATGGGSGNPVTFSRRRHLDGGLHRERPGARGSCA